MSKKSDLRKFKQNIRKNSDRIQKGFLAELGKLDGTVQTGSGNLVYVRTIPEGQLRTVINRRVPNYAGSVVFIGSDEMSANKIEVLYTFNVQGATNNGVVTQTNIVPPHNHSFPGANTTWVYSSQIMPLNCLPIAGTLTVRVYPGVIRKNSLDGWVYVEEQVVDVSGDVPTTSGEALWITLQANDDGSVDYVVGSAAASRSALDETDVPEVTTGRALHAIILEEGRNELFRNNVVNDFLDLRFDRGGGLAFPVDAEDVLYTPNELADWDYLSDPGNASDAFDQLASRTADIEGLIPVLLGYVPENLLDWDYGNDPGGIKEALDQLAARVTDLGG